MAENLITGGARLMTPVHDLSLVVDDHVTFYSGPLPGFGANRFYWWKCDCCSCGGGESTDEERVALAANVHAMTLSHAGRARIAEHQDRTGRMD